jgi:hypothetical protein
MTLARDEPDQLVDQLAVVLPTAADVVSLPVQTPSPAAAVGIAAVEPADPIGPSAAADPSPVTGPDRPTAADVWRPLLGIVLVLAAGLVLWIAYTHG